MKIKKVLLNFPLEKLFLLFLYLDRLQKIGVPVDSSKCRFCEVEEETGWYVLLECPALWRSRLTNMEFAVWSGQQLQLRPGAVKRFADEIGMA